MKQSRTVYVPSGVSSFFEICDRTPEGKLIDDPLKIGARGGGFIIGKGTTTVAFSSNDFQNDEILIDGKKSPEARTSLEVIRLIRKKFKIPPVRISHVIQAPIGQGFGTSGAGALTSSLAVSDLFDLKFSLAKAAEFAHISEINNLTGLGTVISLASGAGAIGLVTEPGTYSVGRTDAILSDPDDYTLVCATFGPTKKSTVLSDERARSLINQFGRKTLDKIMDDPTPERLLGESRVFSEKTRVASTELLKLSDKAVKSGAIGATPNMIGNAIHCLVDKKDYRKFTKNFKSVPKESLFESDLIQSGPRISSSDRHNV
jgi:pantoate kinase